MGSHVNNLAIYEKLVVINPSFERKERPDVFVIGKDGSLAFAFGIEEFLDKYKSGFDGAGVVMKEFVLIPESYFRLPPYFVTLSFITIVLIALELGVLWFTGQPLLLITGAEASDKYVRATSSVPI